MSFTALSDARSWRKRMGRVLAGTGLLVAVSAPATAHAVPALEEGATRSGSGAHATAAANAPTGTITLANRRVGTLTAGDVGASGKGKVHTGPNKGSNLRIQDWNHINGGKLVSRQTVNGRVLCLEASEDKAFIATCEGRKLSQKWAFKIAVDAPGTDGDFYRIQNFQTKECLTPIPPSNGGQLRVAVKDCKAEDQFQQWHPQPNPNPQ